MDNLYNPHIRFKHTRFTEFFPLGTDLGCLFDKGFSPAGLPAPAIHPFSKLSGILATRIRQYNNLFTSNQKCVILLIRKQL